MRGVGVGGAHPGEQIEVAADAAAAKPHRQVVLDLARNQDASPAGGDLERRAAIRGLYLVIPRATSCAIRLPARVDQRGAEFGFAQQALEIATRCGGRNACRGGRAPGMPPA